MLAERTIRAIKPTDKDQFLSDGGGLYIRILPNGRKVFMYKDQRGGKTKWVTLGNYPDLTLLNARYKALDIKNGKVIITTMTIRELCDAYYEHTEKFYKRPEQVIYKLENNIAIPLGSTRLNRVNRPMLTKAFKDVVDRGASIMANRVMEETKKMFDFAVEKGWMESNPISGVTRKTVGGSESSREVNLSMVEIEQFLSMIKSCSGMEEGTAWALYFCLLTGCRASEAIWCLQNRSLDVPEDICKYRNHQIPATPHVRAVLKLAPNPPTWRQTLTASLMRNQCHYTPHDLRRTFASRLSDLGVMPHVIEKLLNHKMEGVMAVYNRAEYWPERIAAQRLWGKTIKALWKKVPGELSSIPA